jgi:CHAD domain-containing protein
MAIGVGVALVRVEIDRRSTRARRERERHFGLLAGEELAQGLKRMALGQLELAIEQLERAGATIPLARAVHETRKALKRLRALLVLVEDELGREQTARERELLRDAGQLLAGARDAEVRLTTLDGLIAGAPRKLAHRRGVVRLRAQLAAERDASAEDALSAQTREQLLLVLRQMHARVAGWTLRGAEGITAVEPALRRRYRRGRRAIPHKVRGERHRARAFHEWRKRVKDLRYEAEILERARDGGAPSLPVARRRRKRAKTSGDATYIRDIAKSADELGEMLGEEHDLGVLAERIRGAGERDAVRVPAGRRTRRALLKLIAKRRRQIRREALKIGGSLYGTRPSRYLDRVRRAFARAR